MLLERYPNQWNTDFLGRFAPLGDSLEVVDTFNCSWRQLCLDIVLAEIGAFCWLQHNVDFRHLAFAASLQSIVAKSSSLIAEAGTPNSLQE